MKSKIIPKFRSIAEEAEFWDTHDVTDYLGDMKLVDVQFAPRQKKEETVTIRIEPKLKSRLENMARSYGINLSTLARIWLVERLQRTGGNASLS